MGRRRPLIPNHNLRVPQPFAAGYPLPGLDFGDFVIRQTQNRHALAVEQRALRRGEVEV